MSRNLLLTPGPTKIPQEIYDVLAKPIIHHRTPQFQKTLKEAVEGLQYIFQTKNDVYLLASSGTGAMEACVCNLLSSGDHVITVDGGKFGERWAEICEAYCAVPHVIKVPWGKAVQAEDIKKSLEANPNIKTVFITLTETSTGVTTNIKAIADVVKKTKAVLVVDAISGLGVTDLQMDNWGVDVVASASHKGFMLPPGLAFIAVSPKAWPLIDSAKSPRYYFDLRKAKEAWTDTDTAFTPAIDLVIALCESLKYMKKIGIPQLFNRFERLAEGTRQAAYAIGFTPFPDASCRSNALTALNIPSGVDGGKLVKILRDVHGISTAGGQDQLKGKIIRIAHMGCVNEEDLITGFTYIEKVLEELGYSFKKGASVEALKKFFSEKIVTHH